MTMASSCFRGSADGKNVSGVSTHEIFVVVGSPSPSPHASGGDALYCLLRLARGVLHGFLHRPIDLLLEPALAALLVLGLLVEPAEVGLPEDGDDAGEDAAALRGDEREVERHDGGPDLPAVGPADGDGVEDAALGLGPGGAGQQALHAEEVRADERGEEELVDEHFHADAEPVAARPRAVVEVPPQEQEVLVARDAEQPADEHGPQRAHRLVGPLRERPRAHHLRAQVAAEVHDHARFQLRQLRPPLLHRAVRAEGRQHGLDPGPGRPGDAAAAAAATGFRRGAMGVGGGGLLGVLGAVLAQDVSLDGLVEPSEGGPSSEEGKGHLGGSRGSIVVSRGGRRREWVDVERYYFLRGLRCNAVHLRAVRSGTLT
nr:hypothetical protein CFP56_19605 [Quercus suber]